MINHEPNDLWAALKCAASRSGLDGLNIDDPVSLSESTFVPGGSENGDLRLVARVYIHRAAGSLCESEQAPEDPKAVGRALRAIAIAVDAAAVLSGMRPATGEMEFAVRESAS